MQAVAALIVRIAARLDQPRVSDIWFAVILDDCLMWGGGNIIFGI